ncbi:MAG: hypothetical protein K2N54_01675 [Helicobacter sp.]|nr:hypothetical protein [Helicobacter sp.]
MLINNTAANAQGYYAAKSDTKTAQKEGEIESKVETKSATNAKIIGSINIGDEQVEKLEKALANTDLSALIKEAQELNDDLEVNWNATVDPDGKIYARTYAESLVKQYESAKNTIEQYYASAHKDNLAQGSEAAAMNYLALKYTKFGRDVGSPYYRSDMSEAERQMALRQERALLLGGRVTLGDPYALQSVGGMLNMEQTEKIAKQAAQDAINQLIREYKMAHGIDEIDVRV